jgi:O-antigen/teichoic acid export membrane protein
MLTSLLSLALLLITTQWMGAENKGSISLLVLNLSLASIFSGLFGGPSLVYLIPRLPFKHLLGLNYAWSAVSAVLVTGILVSGILPNQANPIHFFFMALMECLIATHLMMLLGREKITAHNGLALLKSASVVGILLYMRSTGTNMAYVAFEDAYAISLFATYCLSVGSLIYHRKDFGQQVGDLITSARASLKYGFLVQVGNVAQLMNYRISLYFLEVLIHPPTLALARIGIYSAALQVAEALWQFAKSISTVQYAAVSNLKEEEAHQGLELSLGLGKLNYSVTALGIGLLCLLPASFYETVLGSAFGEVRIHLLILAVGIIALSLSNALSHYFAGIGEHRFNTYSSLFGLVLTIACGYPLIASYGTIGAAITASITYTTQTFYQMLIVKNRKDIAWSAFLVSARDWKNLMQLRKGDR